MAVVDKLDDPRLTVYEPIQKELFDLNQKIGELNERLSGERERRLISALKDLAWLARKHGATGPFVEAAERIAAGDLKPRTSG